MKKVTKTLLAVACVATLSAGALAMVACGDKGEIGEAYALSHKGNYVAYSTVTLKDDKITDVTLTEVELPTQITFGEKVCYAKVTYGNVTMLYDTEAKTYKIGDKTMSEFYATEANCKAYYEAVMGNKITAYETADGAANTTVMTKATLSKEENGYWMCDKKEDGTWDSHASAPYSKDAYSRWKWNRDATVNYVKEKGVEGLSSLVKATENNAKDPTGADVKTWVDANGVSTGATWSDLFNAKGVTGYLTYAQIITKAYNAAKAAK